MRKRIALLSAIVFVFLLTMVSACSVFDGSGHVHEYSDWELTLEPTETEEGIASKKCACGDIFSIHIASLSDEKVWTKSTTDPACTTDGEISYTSVYGTVKKSIDKLGHTFGAWSIAVSPSMTKEGTASRVCTVCGEEDTTVLPVLTDTTVWTEKSHVNPTCTAKGSVVYQSLYGEVTVYPDALGHTYGAWTIVTNPSVTETGVASKTCSVCGDVDTVVLPALTDDSVWELKEEVKPNYVAKGSQTYTSIYGEVTIEVAKLVAPYDGKTYSNVAFDGDEDGKYLNGVLSTETAWSNSSVTFNTTGTAVGTAFPYRGQNDLSILDALTGKVSFVQTPILTDDDGNTSLDTANAVTYQAYVDFATGLMIRTYNSKFNYVFLMTPFEVNMSSSSAVASSWDNSVAIDYTYDGTTYTIFIYKEVVYFNVTLTNEKGETVKANDAWNAPYVYVKDANGNKIASFGFNGEKEVELDGFEGTYTAGEKTVFVSGFGTATVEGVNATYTVSKDPSYTLDVYTSDTYYELTLNEASYVLTKPMVNVTFAQDAYATVENAVVNKNIAYILPVPTNATHQFKGWYYDSALSQKVEDNFIPTVDVELFASWKEKVVINIVGVVSGDTDKLYLGDGDVIGSFLPKYTTDLAAWKVFSGWYLDETFETSLPESAEVSVDDSNITIYAKWVDLPKYYGTFNGPEIWGNESGNKSSQTLNIDEMGNITGYKTGVIVSYDEATQKVVWKAKATDTATKSFYFDATSGIIAGIYNDQEIGSDFYLMTRALGKGECPSASYGIGCTKNATSASTGYYARFIQVNTEIGDITVFLYDNHIYSNVTLSTTSGTPLKVTDLKKAYTVIVKDADGKMIFSLASKDATTNFSDSSYKTRPLDQFFGTYTNGDDTVVLDGTGLIIYGTKSGTYTVSTTAGYGFDVYLENNTEYYQLTLDGTSYTMVKPLVTVSFNVGEGHTAISSQDYNMNVVGTLPSGLDEGYVFNGWFIDASFATPVADPFIPTETTTIFAKYSLPAVLTITYNNGSENSEVVYSVGDVATVEMPVYAKHAFAGWYTSSDFTEGTEWTSGATITENTVIYAKWEEAPIYNNTYTPTDSTGKSTNGGTSSIYTRSTAILALDPYGKTTCNSYPFSGDVEIKNYNPETHSLQLQAGTSIYCGFIDPVSGIIVLNKDTGENPKFEEVMLLNPFGLSFTTSNLFSSYWAGGATRTLEFTHEGTTYSIFVTNKQVYFNVTFTDANGEKVTGEKCYNTPTLYVKTSDGTLIGKYGFDGTTMQFLDGFEGTYTNGEDSLIVDGVKNVDFNSTKGLYTIAKEAAYTLDVYVGGCYYEVTLDKETYTYTINKPMVVITFDAGVQATISPVEVNKNIAITLPTPENDNFVFRGWYKEAAFTTLLDESYVPTETTTIYAKWDEKVTLTVVYGNTLENVVIAYGVGDLAQPVKPLFTNGLAFEGWYLDSEFATPYTPSTMTSSITIYANWKQAHAMYGTYDGSEVWGASKTGTGYTSNQGTLLTIDEVGNVTGLFTGTITDFDATTGTFKLTTGSSFRFGYFDQANDVCVFNYSTSTRLVLDSDIYIMIRNVDSAETTRSTNSYVNGGLVRFVEFTVTTNGVKSTVNVLIYNDKVYGNVSFTDGTNSITAAACYNQTTIVVLDKTGNTIVTFTKNSTTFDAA